MFRKMLIANLLAIILVCVFCLEVDAQIQVSSLNPLNASASVPRDATIRITFNEVVNQSTLDSGTGGIFIRSNFRSLLDYVVEGRLDDGRTVVLRPTQPFLAGETIHVSLTTQIRGQDLSNSLEEPYTFSFTARALKTEDNICDIKFSEVPSCVDDDSKVIDSFVLADFDKDGDIDIAYGTRDANVGDIRIYVNEGDANFDNNPTVNPDGGGVNYLTSGDIDGDSIPEIIASLDGAGFFYYKNRNLDNSIAGGSHIRRDIFNDSNIRARSVHAVDFNNDGFVDVLGTYDNRVVLFKNTGAEPFFSPTNTIVVDNNLNSAEQVTTADLNSDGVLEIIAISQVNDANANVVAIYRQANDEQFTKIDFGQGLNRASSLYIGDILGSTDAERPDIFVSALGVNKIEGYNNADGFATNPTSSLLIDDNINAVSFIYGADINGDEILDLLACARDDQEVIKLYQGSEFNNFATRCIIPSKISQAETIAAADLDGDNDLDFVVSSNLVGQISIFLQNEALIRGTTNACGSITTGYRTYRAPGVSYEWLIDEDDADILGESGGMNVPNVPVRWRDMDGQGTVMLVRKLSCRPEQNDTLFLNVNIRKRPDPRIGVLNDVVCEGDIVTYTVVNTLGEDARLLWNTSNNAGTIVGDSTAQTVQIAWNDVTEDTELEVRETRRDNGGCARTTRIPITILPKPVLIPPNNINNRICVGDTIRYILPKPEGDSSGAFTITWNPDGGVLVAQSDTGTLIAWLEEGIRTLTLTKSLDGPVSCSITETFEIEVLALPQLRIRSRSGGVNREEICIGVPTIYEIDPPNPAFDIEWIINGPGIRTTASPIDQALIQIEWPDTTKGSLQVILRLNDSDCEIATAIEINPIPFPKEVEIMNPDIVSDSGRDVIFACPGSEVILEASPRIPGTRYAWSRNRSGFNFPNLEDSLITVTVAESEITRYQLKEDKPPCTEEPVSQVVEIVPYTFALPNTFTPHNRDGMNDAFRISPSTGFEMEDLAAISSARLIIQDRNGNTVYSTSDVEQAVQVGWDGLKNGQEMAGGTYLYTAQVSFVACPDKVQIKRGSILLSE